jgi:predicted phage tail protein
VIGKRGERLRDIVVTQSSWIKLGGSTYKTTFDITVLNQASLFTFTKSALSDQYFYFSETKHGSKEYRNPTCTVAADVDGNGLTDIVLSGSDGEIRLLYNLRGTTADASWNAIQVDMGSEAMGWTTNSLVTSLSVANLHGGTSIGPIVVPGTPDVTATPSNTKVTLAWEGPAIDGGSPITGYKVYFSADGGHTYTTTLVTPVTMSYTFTDLTNYQKYWFKVSAINAMGEGAAAEVSATPAPTAPAAPTNLAGARGNGQVTLTWIAPSDDGGMPIDYYVVYQNGAALASHPTTTSMLVTGLFNGNTYSFTVAAHNSVGLSEQSGAVSATPATVPGAPTNPLAKRDASTKITVSWAAPTSNGGSAITGYVIYYNWNSATSTFTSSMNVGLVSSYQFTGLTNGKTYYYMVRAVNELGQGADSTIVFATP